MFDFVTCSATCAAVQLPAEGISLICVSLNDEISSSNSEVVLSREASNSSVFIFPVMVLLVIIFNQYSSFSLMNGFAFFHLYQAEHFCFGFIPFNDLFGFVGAIVFHHVMKHIFNTINLITPVGDGHRQVCALFNNVSLTTIFFGLS